MLDKTNKHEYNYRILSRERKKQKFSQEYVSIQLTLSVSQIKSLEKNLQSGFIAPHFKNLALKRYAEFLGIDLNKVIPIDINDDLKSDTPESDIHDIQIESSENTNLPFQSKFKLKKFYVVPGIILACLLFVFTTVKFANVNDEVSNEETVAPKVDTSIKKTPIKVILSPVNKDFTPDKKVNIASKKVNQKNKSNIVSIEFLCSIKSASMDKIWSRVNPEKPATYFHIISQEKQSICTIDNRGIFKQYDLDAGAKITHRGEAPFKIQLNPSISQLYFQGWKVILGVNDNFVLLNPVNMPSDIN